MGKFGPQTVRGHVRTCQRIVTGPPLKVVSSSHVPQSLPKLWGHLHVIGREEEKSQWRIKERKIKENGRVRARQVAPKPSPHMGWVWGLSDSPDVWGEFGGDGWVHNFTLSPVRTAVRTSIRTFGEDLAAVTGDALHSLDYTYDTMMLETLRSTGYSQASSP